MKIYTTVLIALFLITACKKGTNDSSNSALSTVAVSIHISDPGNHAYYVDSFVRDANNRLVKLVRSYADTITSPPQFASEFSFTYSGNDSLPISYNITPNNDLHKLRYDGQMRIVMDSSTLIRNTFYFSYSSSGTIIYQDLPPNIGHYIDTVVLTNENISERKYWFFQPTYTSRDYFNNTYSSLTNPIRFPGSMGFLLFEITGLRDYLSKNLISQSVDNSQVAFTATWSTNGNGRVIAGRLEVPPAIGSKYSQSITYQY